MIRREGRADEPPGVDARGGQPDDDATLRAALTVLAGTGRVRIKRIPCELAALNRVRAELDARAARIAELEAREAARGKPECGDWTPTLYATDAPTTWCIRWPGHGMPHRDGRGAEWRPVDGAQEWKSPP